MNYTDQEVQSDVSDFIVTLLSDEIISLPCITDENIIEERDNYINIELESSTYCQRLYDAFRNKELVKSIKKNSIYRKITGLTDVNREFTYDGFFKIDGFNTYHPKDNCAIYTITFQSV